jgi:hypothetical protein
MRTWVAGEVVTAAYMNANVRDAGNFFITPPSAYIYQNTPQAALVTATLTLITWDTAAYQAVDTSVWSAGTNPSRWTPATPGYYSFVASLLWATNAAGSRNLMVRKNAAGASGGGTLVQQDSAFASSANGHNSLVVTTVQMNGTTDYLEVFGYQNSGGNLALLSGAPLAGVSMQTRWLNS